MDDWCMLAGTDTNFPGTNQFGLTRDQVPHFQQVADTRWMIVCYYDPVFSTDADIADMTQASEVTCSDVKSLYKENKCCGQPDKIVSKPAWR